MDMGSGDDGATAQLTEVAKVDLRGLVAPGTPRWAETRAAVTASMKAHGCVMVVHDAIGTELRRALFGGALPELFALPFDVKKRSGFFSNGPEHTYDSQAPNAALEGVGIPGAAEPGTIRDWASRLWPQGNPDFCDTLVSFAKSVVQLEEMVERMTLEGLGVREESIRWHLGLLSHGRARVALYGTPPETGISLHAHKDDHMSTVIVQHEVGGLEFKLNDGRWFAVPPELGTLTLVAGDQFTVVTNGRVPACVHRVRTPCNADPKRFTAMVNTRRMGEAVVRTMDELVDEDHPLLYDPCACEEYRAFLYSSQGFKLRDPLKTFCGVKKDESMDG